MKLFHDETVLRGRTISFRGHGILKFVSARDPVVVEMMHISRYTTTLVPEKEYYGYYHDGRYRSIIH